MHQRSSRAEFAHKSEKLQFEIIPILGLLSLFTHEHLFWVTGLLLAFIEFPDFATPMGRIATSLETIADATGALVNDGEAVRELEPARAEVQGRAESPVKRSVAAERPAAAKG